MWNAHAIRADHKASADGVVRSEYVYEVVETRRGDSGNVKGGDLKFNRGQRSGVFRRGRLLQVFREGTTSRGL